MSNQISKLYSEATQPWLCSPGQCRADCCVFAAIVWGKFGLKPGDSWSGVHAGNLGCHHRSNEWALSLTAQTLGAI